MRYVLALSFLAMTGCASDDSIGFRNPCIITNTPKIAPAGWVALSPAPQQVAMPQYAAPAPSACAPAYAPAYQYAAPPVPAAAGSCR